MFNICSVLETKQHMFNLGDNMTKSLITIVFLLLANSLALASQSNNINSLNTQRIEQLTGAKGQLDKTEQVFKVSVPRSDLSVTTAGVKMVPAMGLTTWAAFKKVDGHTIMMGDMTLTQDQVNAVMDVALNNGLSVTALHNHFFWDDPKIMFMHIEGMGKEDDLAESVGKVFAAIKKTSQEGVSKPEANIDPTKSSLDAQKIDQILGIKGAITNNVYKVTVGRTTQMEGHTMGNAMGVNTWAAFAGSDELAVVDGDFAMHESEVQDVLKALRKANIYIVAIHQHMLGEKPRIIFLHFWGVGTTESLAKGLASALAITSNKKPNNR